MDSLFQRLIGGFAETLTSFLGLLVTVIALRTHGGLGLGLAIVDYLVRQQAGAVYVESEGPGKGATFIVEFPLTSSEVMTSDLGRVDLFSNQARLMLENSETFSEQKLKDLRILVVEDDADTRDLLQTILERCGAKVRTASSSSAALAELAQGIPNVLISDIGMPDESGYDLIKKIQITIFSVTSWRSLVGVSGVQMPTRLPVLINNLAHPQPVVDLEKPVTSDLSFFSSRTSTRIG